MGTQESIPYTAKAPCDIISQSSAQKNKAIGNVIFNATVISDQNVIPPKQIFKYTISLQNLKDAFKSFAIHNDFLNKDLFNDAIQSLFRFPMPEMQYTYLSERIYELLDDSGDGKIQEDEFIEGFKKVLMDKEFRIRCKPILSYNSINDGYDE